MNLLVSAIYIIISYNILIIFITTGLTKKLSLQHKNTFIYIYITFLNYYSKYSIFRLFWKRNSM